MDDYGIKTVDEIRTSEDYEREMNILLTRIAARYGDNSREYRRAKSYRSEGMYDAMVALFKGDDS